MEPYPPRLTNGIGKAGFVLSILAILLCWLPNIGGVLWISGLGLSIAGLFKKPRGLALTGLILSLFAGVLFIFLFSLFLIFSS